MEYEKNKKYFTKKSWTLAIIGIVIIAVAAVLILLLRREMKLIAVVGAVAGVGVLIAGLTGGMKDDDIDTAVATVVNGMEARAAEVFKFPRRFETLHPQVVLGGWDYTRKEETPYKRGGDLKYRSTFYCTCLFSFTNDGLRVLSKKFSIVEDNCKEDVLFFPWEDIEKAQMDEEEVSFTTVAGEAVNLKIEVLRLIMKDGQVYSYCVKNTADVDETIDCIYRQTVKVKQGQLKAGIDR